MHTIFLLQRTAFRNGVLLKDALWSEARKGNLRPWLVFAAAVSLGDEVLADLYDLVHGSTDRITSLPKQIEDAAEGSPGALLAREAENLAFHGGLGMVKMLIEPLKYGVPLEQVMIGPFWSQLTSLGNLLVKDMPEAKNWHKRWLQTWRFLRRSYPPLSMVERGFGVPGETAKEKRDREKRAAKYRHHGSSHSSGTIRPAPQP